jgi:hypothetical protein
MVNNIQYKLASKRNFLYQKLFFNKKISLFKLREVLVMVIILINIYKIRFFKNVSHNFYT